MADKLNHHWVPRYHLKLFSGREHYIHFTSRDGARVVERASIRHQCARHKFYGNREVEDWLHGLETRHATAYRAVLAVARKQQDEPLKTRDAARLREALLLQRARTPRAARVHADAIEQSVLYTYRDHLRNLPLTHERARVIRAIEEGRASMVGSEARSLMNALRFASRMGPLIADLRLLILRNATDDPLIMGDTPCLCSNHYLRGIEGVGVLGLSLRGLMIYMPIDSHTAVLFFDKAVYRAPRFEHDSIAMTEPADVAVLNSLEAYGARDSVYFANWGDREHVRSFVAARPPTADARLAGFNVLRPARAQSSGAPQEEILHTFEPQLPVTIDLSFIRTRRLPPNVNLKSPRRPKAVNRLTEDFKARPRGAGLGIDDLVRWVESELKITSGPGPAELADDPHASSDQA